MRRGRGLAVLAATLVLAPAIEFAGRSVARASIFEALTGRNAGGLALVLTAAAGAVLGVRQSRRSGSTAHTRSWHGGCSSR